MILLCPRITGPARIHGSSPDQCARCSHPVWVSIASAVAAGDDAERVCVPCLLEETDRNGTTGYTLMPPTPGQHAEIAARWGRN